VTAGASDLPYEMAAVTSNDFSGEVRATEFSLVGEMTLQDAGDRRPNGYHYVTTRFHSQPFDGDGFPSRRRVIVDKGVLEESFVDRRRVDRDRRGLPLRERRAHAGGGRDERRRQPAEVLAQAGGGGERPLAVQRLPDAEPLVFKDVVVSGV
jgi:hypothetical protein